MPLIPAHLPLVVVAVLVWPVVMIRKQWHAVIIIKMTKMTLHVSFHLQRRGKTKSLRRAKRKLRKLVRLEKADPLMTQLLKRVQLRPKGRVELLSVWNPKPLVEFECDQLNLKWAMNFGAPAVLELRAGCVRIQLT